MEDGAYMGAATRPPQLVRDGLPLPGLEWWLRRSSLKEATGDEGAILAPREDRDDLCRDEAVGHEDGKASRMPARSGASMPRGS
jgi:hypothetical protein